MLMQLSTPDGFRLNLIDVQIHGTSIHVLDEDNGATNVADVMSEELREMILEILGRSKNVDWIWFLYNPNGRVMIYQGDDSHPVELQNEHLIDSFVAVVETRI